MAHFQLVIIDNASSRFTENTINWSIKRDLHHYSKALLLGCTIDALEYWNIVHNGHVI